MIKSLTSEERGGDTLSVERATGRTAINSVSRVEVEENNPVRSVVRIDGQIAGVAVTQRLLLYRGLKRIDLENVVDWHQGRFNPLIPLSAVDQSLDASNRRQITRNS